MNDLPIPAGPWKRRPPPRRVADWAKADKRSSSASRPITVSTTTSCPRGGQRPMWPQVIERGHLAQAPPSPCLLSHARQLSATSRQPLSMVRE